MSDRIALIRRVIYCGLALLLLRLAHLQLVHGARYRALAEHNRLRLIPQPAPRGLLLDRAGERLATSRETFQVSVIPQDLPVEQRLASSGQATAGDARARAGRDIFQRLGSLLDQPAEDLERQFRANRSLPFLPVALARNIPKSLALRIEEERAHLPGVLVESVVTRDYPLGSVAAHLIGYVGKPSAEAFPTLKQYGVRAEDLVGRSGLEQKFDDVLRGRSGGSMIEVDNRARQVRVMGYRQPVAGAPISLTLDAGLQALIEDELGAQPGACVVLQPQTGAVLAMASVPAFDPGIFSIHRSSAIHAVMEDPDAPLMNRATLGAYIPGSIIKPLTAMAALEQGLISPESTLECPGFLDIGDRRFHCWNRDGHGAVRLREAILQSCNVYFMQVGRRLGLARLRGGFSALGFGQGTGWILDESPGHVPGSRRFSEGEVALLAMGQSEILITPIQAAVMASAIANRGWVVKPWVVKTIGGRTQAHAKASSLGWSARHVAAVSTGMLAVVNDPRGTGISAQSPRITIAGKTGTAQTHLPGRPHGWFIGFCPADEPLAAFAIVAEHGGSGGELPAMVARAICEYLAPAPS